MSAELDSVELTFGSSNPSRQLGLLDPAWGVDADVAEAATEHGEVFTRRWVVDLILDLAGYLPAMNLAEKVLVEPSCGTGAFVLPVVERLVESCRRHRQPLETLHGAMRAFDLLDANAECTRKAVMQRLGELGASDDLAETLANAWIVAGDFLLTDHAPASADYVVGNPPYVRLESVPPSRMEAYRRACPTMRGRADVYVGFMERGLELLQPDGVLAFICADRWMRNQYGAELRDLIARRYAIETVISMHDVDAFEAAVSAYPAIVVVRNRPQGRAVVVEASEAFGEQDARDLTAWTPHTRSMSRVTSAYTASRADSWVHGRELWPNASPSRLALIADLEARFPPLQDTRTGTRVGIGVATGCDEVYITGNNALVEADRLLPLLQAPDVVSGVAVWSGAFLVNPWDSVGLVDLRTYPGLAAYFAQHRARLQARHVARRSPSQWYRTIDRVSPTLLNRPKLVLPDLKASAHPVLDDGQCYPHHNLYYVVSDAWDPEVLGGILLSGVADLFVGAYCVRMRGDTYRFQAQYLRKIRVPDQRAVDRRAATELARAFADRDRSRADAAASRLYGVDLSSVR